MTWAFKIYSVLTLLKEIESHYVFPEMGSDHLNLRLFRIQLSLNKKSIVNLGLFEYVWGMGGEWVASQHSYNYRELATFHQQTG